MKAMLIYSNEEKLEQFLLFLFLHSAHFYYWIKRNTLKRFLSINSFWPRLMPREYLAEVIASVNAKIWLKSKYFIRSY